VIILNYYGGSNCFYNTADNQLTADGQRSTTHLTELQNLFSLVSGEKADNHKGEYKGYDL
jgi:hypothetical protein